MNKDVVYIEPEDDITDIITKIENAKERVVALVPPKKTAVLRSIVNIKLIAKAGAGAGKTVVFVTTDPAIVKLAAAVRMPVTKNLQSAPVIPEATEIETETVSREEVIEEDESKSVVKNTETEVEEVETGEDAVSSDEEGVSLNEEEKEPLEPENDKKGEEGAKKGPKKEKRKKVIPDKTAKPFSKPWLLFYKKWLIGGGCGLVALILVFIWMFKIAPAATVNLGIRTTSSSFSENITFTTKIEEEDAETGKFYIIEKKAESTAEVEFTATGEKNVGEKATGKVQIYAYLGDNESVTVAAGATLTTGGKGFLVDEAVTLSAGASTSGCANADNLSELRSLGCLIYASVEVTAKEPGTIYNIGKDEKWSILVAGVGATSGTTSGGTDEMITVVQQSDIEAAEKSLSSGSESENKEKLFASIEGEDVFIIKESFKQTVSDAVSAPKIGEEVKEGAKAKLSVVTTDTVYVIDKTKLEEFIAKKAKLPENFKIYSMNDPFIESFVQTDGGFAGKLKTTIVAGPKVTREDVIEMIRGEGVGTATTKLGDIDGIGSVNIVTSFPWVASIPNDPNKITVNIDTGE